MNNSNDQIKTPRLGRFFSPRYFLVRALVLGAVFLVAHALGLREYTTFLSGTTGEPGTDIHTSALYGTIYILLYLGCVVLAPTLLLAAGLLAGWQRFVAAKVTTLPATDS